MSSTSMPPPPSPLARRRTRLNYQNDSSCLPRNMSLSKGATFHIASSPSTDADPVLSVPHLTRRSPTCSHSSLVSLLSEKRELAAQSIADFEQTFSGARGTRRSSRRQSADEFNQQLKSLRAALPTDEGLGSSIGSPSSERGLSKALASVEIQSNTDSALGESVSGSVVERVVLSSSEGNERVATELVKDTDNKESASIQTRTPGNAPRHHTTATPHSTYLPPSSRSAYHPALSRFARKKILELVIKPILQEEKYKSFHPLATNLASRTHKNVRCLRDLEQSLIFQPLARGFAVTPDLYRSFGEFTVQLTVDTFQHLSESDQRRATDQAYTSGYFLDLVQQINQLAAHIGKSSDQEGETDPEVPALDDEITLEGGLGNTGEIAELVRWRNGKGISLRTGLPYEPVAGIKRQASNMSPEDIERSMARRKKGYIPEYVEMHCSDPTCDKIFTRKCDLAKHEKTHSRPFKCPHANCKYSEVGLPTEKERERHINDKHDPNPHLYKCNYCEFKTKRESNCKQHMEKKHGWDYRRAKGKDRDISSTPAQTPNTPLEYDFNAPIEPSPAQGTYQNFDDGSSVSGSVPGSTHFTPYEDPVTDFGTFNQYSAPLFPRQPSQPNQFAQNNGFDFSGVSNTGYDQLNGYASPVSANMNTKMTPVTPAYSAITGMEPSPYAPINNNFANAPIQCYGWNDGLPTPESAVHATYSRNASVQYDSPSDMTRSLSGNPMMDQTMGSKVPSEDFTLFGGGVFTNAAGPDQTLFPAADNFNSQEFTASAFEPLDGMDMDLENECFDDIIDFNN